MNPPRPETEGYVNLVAPFRRRLIVALERRMIGEEVGSERYAEAIAQTEAWVTAMESLDGPYLADWLLERQGLL